MAKPFQEIVNIAPARLSTGQPQYLMSLSEKLDNFTSFVAQREGQKQIEKATIEGKQAGITQQQGGGKLELQEETFIGGIRKSAYNKALQSGYLASLENDNRENISRIASENPTNLIKFNEAVNAYSKSTLDGVDPAARGIAQLSLDTSISSARQTVQSNEIQKNITEADNAMILSIQDSSKEALRFANTGDIENSANSMLAAFAVIDARVDSGQIDPSAAVVMRRELEKGATVETIRFTMRNTREKQGVIKSVEVIQMVDEKPLKGFSVKEQEALSATLKADLSQFLQLENIKESEQESQLKLRQDAAFSDLFLGVLTGNADAADIVNAGGQKNISAEQLVKLSNTFNTRGQGLDDFSLIRSIQEVSLTNPDLAKQMISENTGSRLTEATAGGLYTTALESENKESPLHTSRSKRFKTFVRNSVKVVGFLGAVDFDSQKRLASLEITFDERVLAGDDPAVVARELVDINEVLTMPNPRFGTKDNLPAALNELNKQFDLGLVDDTEYYRQLKLITELQEKQENLARFEKSFSEAMKE